MKAWHGAMICLFFAVGATACSDPGEYGRFDTAQSANLRDCMAEQFPFEGDLFAARMRNGRLGIFLQSTPDITSKADIFYFEIYDPESITVGDPIALDGPSVPPPPARADVGFFSSCAHTNESLSIGGSIVFNSFDYQNAGVISGELLDGQFIDKRNGQVVVDDLSGEWNFVVRRGPPYEDFYALPERP